ncbi:glycosyltransferase [Picosynechococcus sp. PCC 73109]|uniref:glycosyltransferase n=1 Tax=Picosynechococcus sp. PCC 73109 TaxID=374982 RepID=UPI0009007532|nr:glycosyltransferase [Picosynechococcus sp. PCC 73109]
MKILVIHNRYRNRAGEDSTFDQEVALLQQSNHSIQVWTKDNKDIDVGDFLDAIRLALSTIWSSKSYRELLAIIDDFKPDIIHVHNTLPLLSPSIFYAAKKRTIPTVVTIQNYRLSCPKGTFFRNNSTCEICLNKSLLFSVYYKCYRDSRLQTVTVALMLQVHRLLRTWTETITAYIAVSPFVRNKLVEMGIPAEKIYLKPNFLQGKTQQPETIDFGKYYLFVGRLETEKGILNLLNAYQNLKSEYPLYIVGSGGLQSVVEQYASDNYKIQYLGQRTREEVIQYMQGAIALIFPSTWYEGFPLTILEAYSQSLPVIGSNIGSVSYAIQNGITGLTYPVGDEKALTQALFFIEANPEKWLALKQRVLENLDDIYFADQNINYLLEIYRSLIEA